MICYFHSKVMTRPHNQMMELQIKPPLKRALDYLPVYYAKQSVHTCKYLEKSEMYAIGLCSVSHSCVLSQHLEQNILLEFI